MKMLVKEGSRILFYVINVRASCIKYPMNLTITEDVESYDLEII